MLQAPKAALLTGICLSALLAGCAKQPPSVALPNTGQQGVNVNDSQSFFPDQTADDAGTSSPSLRQMENAHFTGDTSAKDQAERTVRLPALRDAALKYGVEGGLAYSTKLMNQVLRTDAELLSKSYDFNRLVTMEQGGAMILPPVISQSNNTYEETDSGSTIRVANTTYDIVREAQFAPSAPLWYGYLYRPVHAPDDPPVSLLPKTDEERQAWVQYVDMGWKVGIQQGVMTFKLDLARLNQDFTGMIRYRTLYDAGKVSAPIVQNYDLGTTGTGKTMRENDRVERIIAEPLLQAHSAPAGMPFSDDGQRNPGGDKGPQNGGAGSPLPPPSKTFSQSSPSLAADAIQSQPDQQGGDQIQGQ
jgi:defect-in-organelle-trafficking protein DotC